MMRLEGDEWFIRLPDDSGEWALRAFKYPDADTARVEWERLEASTRGKGENFSLWRTTTPARDLHLVLVCGRPHQIPSVEGGEPFLLDEYSARDFFLRRAKVSADAFKERPDADHFEQVARYGYDRPGRIDSRTGEIGPSKR